MPFTYLVGLHVTDDDAYDAYRAGMTPILERYGGGFGYDMRVSEVLRAEMDELINRVFTIYFPDEATAGAFFSDADYLEVKRQHFDVAVAATTVMATYETAR